MMSIFLSPLTEHDHRLDIANVMKSIAGFSVNRLYNISSISGTVCNHAVTEDYCRLLV